MSEQPITIFLGLGSNIGNREKYLNQAIDLLPPLVTVTTCSSIYESEALLKEDAPDQWNQPYLNMVLRGTTLLAPEALLAHVKSIETELGRKQRGSWAPREIDIDILLYGDQTYQSESLTIPHPHMLERDFVLKPLREIAPSDVGAGS